MILPVKFILFVERVGQSWPARGNDVIVAWNVVAVAQNCAGSLLHGTATCVIVVHSPMCPKQNVGQNSPKTDKILDHVIHNE